MITFCFSPSFSITYLKLSLVFPTPSSLLEAAVTEMSIKILFQKDMLLWRSQKHQHIRITLFQIKLPAIFHSMSDRFSKTRPPFDIFSSWLMWVIFILKWEVWQKHILKVIEPNLLHKIHRYAWVENLLNPDYMYVLWPRPEWQWNSGHW